MRYEHSNPLPLDKQDKRTRHHDYRRDIACWATMCTYIKGAIRRQEGERHTRVGSRPRSVL